MVMVKIFLRSIQSDIGNGKENCLSMRDSNGNEGINNLVTAVTGGSKVIWELEKQSGIKSIYRIWAEAARSKVFKNEPKKILLKKGFQVDLVDSDSELEGKYNIEYILDDETKMIIDPYIRILPPSIIG
jgi:hypothetical protein